MPKPDPALLDPARYPFHCTIEPRFGDLDVNLHINNVAIASILEDAHIRFHRVNGYSTGLNGLATMVVSVTIDYLAEGHYHQPLEVYVALERLGRTSHDLVKLVRQGDRTVAFSRTIIVSVGKDGPAPLPASFVQQAQQWSLRL